MLQHWIPRDGRQDSLTYVHNEQLEELFTRPTASSAAAEELSRVPKRPCCRRQRSSVKASQIAAKHQASPSLYSSAEQFTIDRYHGGRPEYRHGLLSS